MGANELTAAPSNGLHAAGGGPVGRDVPGSGSSRWTRMVIAILCCILTQQQVNGTLTAEQQHHYITISIAKAIILEFALNWSLLAG